MCVCVRVRVCVRACACVCVRACERAGLHECELTFVCMRAYRRLCFSL